MVADNDKVFIEFVEQGGFVKVTAIHAASGTEVSLAGPASASRQALANAATQKLAYVLNKKRGEA